MLERSEPRAGAGKAPQKLSLSGLHLSLVSVVLEMEPKGGVKVGEE